MGAYRDTWRWSTLTMVEIMAKPGIARILAGEGAEVTLVGRWLWVTFPDKPSARVRRFLSAVGFRWNRTRVAWQHSCGYRTHRSSSDPRFTYGQVAVDDRLASAIGGAA